MIPTGCLEYHTVSRLRPLILVWAIKSWYLSGARAQEGFLRHPRSSRCRRREVRSGGILGTEQPVVATLGHDYLKKADLLRSVTPTAFSIGPAVKLPYCAVC